MFLLTILTTVIHNCYIINCFLLYQSSLWVKNVNRLLLSSVFNSSIFILRWRWATCDLDFKVTPHVAQNVLRGLCSWALCFVCCWYRYNWCILGLDLLKWMKCWYGSKLRTLWRMPFQVTSCFCCFFSKKIFLYVHCFDTVSWKLVELVMQSEGALEYCSSLCLLWKVCRLNRSYVD